MDKKSLEEFVRKYKKWSNDLIYRAKSEGINGMHFMHITRNLLSHVTGFETIQNVFKNKPELARKMFGNSPEEYLAMQVRIMRTYRALIRRHKHFREGELKGGSILEGSRGHFSDVNSDGEKGIENYVFEAKRRLTIKLK